MWSAMAEMQGMSGTNDARDLRLGGKFGVARNRLAGLVRRQARRAVPMALIARKNTGATVTPKVTRSVFRRPADITLNLPGFQKRF